MEREGCSVSRTRGPTSWPIVAVLAVFVLLATVYSAVDPVFEPPDEWPHYRYIRDLVETRRLPVLELDGPQLQSHQPPLYYVIGALLTGWTRSDGLDDWQVRRNVFFGYKETTEDHWNLTQYLHCESALPPYDGVAMGLHLYRLFSVALGALTAWLTFMTGRELWPGRHEVAWGGAAIAGLVPMYLFISGAVNNDTLLATLSAAILFICARTIRLGMTASRVWALGGLVSAAILSKVTGLLLLPVVAYTLIASTSLHREWRRLTKAALVVVGAVAALTGWWFVRNWALYGDPTAVSRTLAVWQGRPGGADWMAALREIPNIWTSFWGRFGYGQIRLPDAIYALYAALTATAVSGLARAGLRVAQARQDSRQRLLRGGLLGLAAVVFAAAPLYYSALSPTGAFGRYIFPALAAIALLLARGVSEWLPLRVRTLALAGVATAMLVASVVALTGYLAPAYARPRLLQSDDVQVGVHPLDVRYGGVVELLGYDLPITSVDVGERLPVTLYWRSAGSVEEDYVVGLALVGPDGEPWAKADSFPGGGTFSTRCWQPGDTFADTYPLTIDRAADAPAAGRLVVVLRDGSGQALTPTDSAGQPVPLVAFGPIRVAPPAPPVYAPRHTTRYVLSDRVSLIGYDLSQDRVQPGEAIELTLYWRAERALHAEYHVFVHVTQTGPPVAQSDGPPANGAYPCTLWLPGEVVKDSHRVHLPADVAPGEYEIRVGMYDLADSQRLWVRESAGGEQSYVRLARIRVGSGQ